MKCIFKNAHQIFQSSREHLQIALEFHPTNSLKTPKTHLFIYCHKLQRKAANPHI